MKKHLKVFGQKVKIRFVVNLMHNNRFVWGLYSYDEKTIFLADQLKEKKNIAVYQETLFHELIHAAFHILGYSQTSLSSDLEELIAENVSKVVLSNFRIG
jgi:hypothetical protein